MRPEYRKEASALPVFQDRRVHLATGSGRALVTDDAISEVTRQLSFAL